LLGKVSIIVASMVSLAVYFNWNKIQDHITNGDKYQQRKQKEGLFCNREGREKNNFF
jgi:hypothetical protein